MRKREGEGRRAVNAILQLPRYIRTYTNITPQTINNNAIHENLTPAMTLLIQP